MFAGFFKMVLSECVFAYINIFVGANEITKMSLLQVGGSLKTNFICLISITKFTS